jgi:protein phosphatase
VQEIPLTAEGTEWLAVASVSDVGCVRDNNEDSIGVFPGEGPARGTLLVVADGMGGAAAGEVASRIAVDTVGERFFASEAPPAAALQEAVEAGNAAIHARAASDPNLSGMGTTCTAVAVIGREAWFAHVGDSRAYVVDRGRLRQITRDHSLAAEYERHSGDTAVPVRARNVLTRCLGVRPAVEVDVSAEPIVLADDGTLVICSDGLCNQVADGEIHQVVTMHRPDGACRRLVQLAKERGAPDNVSVAIARITRD